MHIVIVVEITSRHHRSGRFTCRFSHSTSDGSGACFARRSSMGTSVPPARVVCPNFFVLGKVPSSALRLRLSRLNGDIDFSGEPKGRSVRCHRWRRRWS